MKKFLFVLAVVLVALFAAAQVHAIGLEISDISVDVDDDTDNGVDANGGSFEARPDAKIELTVEVTNTHPVTATNHEVRDVTVQIDVDPMCDNDVDEKQTFTDDLKDLDPSDDDQTRITFRIPKCANEDDYDVDITVEGKDEDRSISRYRIKESLRLSVNRNGRQIEFLPVTLTPNIISCNRDFQADVEIHNIGAIDENTGLRVFHKQLELEKYIPFKLTSERDYFAEGSYFKGPVNLSLGHGVPAGKYPLRFEVEYGPQKTEAIQYADIEVQQCAPNKAAAVVVQEPIQTTTTTTTATGSGGVVGQTQTTQTTQTGASTTVTTTAAPQSQVTAPSTPVQAAQDKTQTGTDGEGVSATQGERTLIMVGIVIAALLLIAVIVLMYYLLRK